MKPKGSIGVGRGWRSLAWPDRWVGRREWAEPGKPEVRRPKSETHPPLEIRTAAWAIARAGGLGFLSWRSSARGPGSGGLRRKRFPETASGWALVILAVLVGVLASGRVQAQPEPVPLPSAHAHNDYEHARPLLDALAQGFCSVEADIHLVAGKLLVAHDAAQTRPDRTLEALYLEPLRARTRQNGGRVFRGGPPVTLLIDIKTEAEPTYTRLHAVLTDYADMLTRFEGEQVQTNAVTVIISGNRPRDLMARQPVRYAGYDGRLADLDAPVSPHFMPWVSDNWRAHFTWRGVGPLPEAERVKLEQVVARAHAQGRRLRFWGAPDVPAVWQALRDAGVDLINTDRLAELAEFLRSGSVK